MLCQLKSSESFVFGLFWRFISKVNIGTQQTILRCSAKLLKAVLINILERANQTDDPQKTTAKCSVKLLRYALQNTKRYSETYWKVFCKTDEKFSTKIVKRGSVKILIRGPQKYCEIFCKNTKGCSTKLKSILENFRGEFHTLTQNEQLPCKSSRTFSV